MSATITVIQARRGWIPVDLRELWRARDLLRVLALRDVKVRYKQSALGVAWAVIQPLLTMIVFSVLFGALMGADGRPAPPGVPYTISTFCALVPWQLFAGAFSQASESVVANRELVTKVYFPRLLAPAAPILASLLDFAIAFVVLVLMIAGYALFTDYTFAAGPALIALPLFVLLAVTTALALSLWLSALNALYRDVRYAIPFMLQLLLYVSPVVYAAGNVVSADAPAWMRIAYGLNPVAGVVEGFRWSLLGTAAPDPLLLAASGISVAVLLVGGLFYFKRMERTFADVV